MSPPLAQSASFPMRGPSVGIDLPRMPQAPAQGGRQFRPPSTINDVTGKGARKARKAARQAARLAAVDVPAPRPRMRTAGIALILTALCGAGLFSLRFFEAQLAQLVGGLAATPLLVMLATSTLARFTAAIRVPRPLVIVTAALSASFGLLAGAFFTSWTLGLGASPFPPTDLGSLPSALSTRLSGLTGLTGSTLMLWWAGLVLTVTMLASLGAARLAGYRNR